ncbi:MAG: ferritin family protein [Bacillota bacterium]|nr:ferritin family protein [Bacillota bacterium]
MDTNNENINEVELTTYDRLIRAWENSKELVRDYEMYSKRIEEKNIKDVFKQFAEDEGTHATKLREMILKYRKDSVEQ